MEGDELAAIRAKRLAQLQATGAQNSRSANPPALSAAGSGAGGKENDSAEQQKRQQEEARRSMLAQILSNEARERLARIQLVKVEKARSVEDYLLMMARSGSLRERVTEPQLIGILEQISQRETDSQPKIIMSRRRDDEDDFDLSEFDL